MVADSFERLQSERRVHRPLELTRVLERARDQTAKSGGILRIEILIPRDERRGLRPVEPVERLERGPQQLQGEIPQVAHIEDLIDQLRESYAIVIVTHSMQQAARVSQRTAYFHLGSLVEVGETDRVFTNPRHKLTEDYITGRFG